MLSCCMPAHFVELCRSNDQRNHVIITASSSEICGVIHFVQGGGLLIVSPVHGGNNRCDSSVRD